MISADSTAAAEAGNSQTALTTIQTLSRLTTRRCFMMRTLAWERTQVIAAAVATTTGIPLPQGGKRLQQATLSTRKSRPVMPQSGAQGLR